MGSPDCGNYNFSKLWVGSLLAGPRFRNQCYRVQKGLQDIYEFLFLCRSSQAEGLLGSVATDGKLGKIAVSASMVLGKTRKP